MLVRRSEPGRDYFEAKWKPKAWKTPHRFLFIRTRVKQQHKEPIQLDLFVPHDYGYELTLSMSANPAVQKEFCII